MQGAARCYDRMLAVSPDDVDGRAEWISRAAEHFEAVLFGAGDQLPTAWDPVLRAAAVEAARFRILQPDGYMSARAVLEAAMAAPPPQTPSDAWTDWRTAVQHLLIVAQTGSGDRAAARRTLRQASTGPPEGWIGLLAGLSEIAARAPDKARSEIAALQLEAAALGPDDASLTADQRGQRDRLVAVALAAAGRRAEALARFRQLIQRLPDEGDLLESYAQLLSAGNDRTSAEKALAQWRELLRRSRPQSPRWYRAKYGVALAHHQLGRPAEAAQMIRLLQQLYPVMGDTGLEQKFQDLLAKCRKAE